MGLVFETFTRDLIGILVCLVALAYYYVHRSYGIWARKGVYFIKPDFPFGNFKETLLQRTSFGNHIGNLYHNHQEPVVGIWRAFRPTLLIRDPEIVRQVFIKDFNTFHDRGLYSDEKRDPLSAHLFSLGGDKWRKMRGKLSPTFTSGKLKGMFSTLLDCGEPLDAVVARVAKDSGTIEIRELLAQYTTNIIASVAFGIEVDCIADPETSFRKFGRKVFAPSFKNGLRGAISFLFPKLFPVFGLKVVDQDVEDFLMSVVRKNMEYREQNKVTRKDFFQLLVQLRNTGTIQEHDDWATTVTSETKSLSIGECAAQSFVFYVAGFETSSTTMSFALYELAKNQQCLKRAQREIDEILVKNNGQITYESVSEMKYLDWVIDETLRIYPPVPMLSREASTSWTIPNSDVTIDKGTAIIIPAMALQHDPKYWPQPLTFIPERFSPEQSADTTFADRPYMPFGEGPRNCIGLRLGKLQTKMGLIVMLQKYNYELAGSSKLPMTMSTSSFLLSPVGGINLQITYR